LCGNKGTIGAGGIHKGREKKEVGGRNTHGEGGEGGGVQGGGTCSLVPLLSKGGHGDQQQGVHGGKERPKKNPQWELRDYNGRYTYMLPEKKPIKVC
jgi:hypothetical protein